jgi:hypothetical protein
VGRSLDLAVTRATAVLLMLRWHFGVKIMKISTKLKKSKTRKHLVAFTLTLDSSATNDIYYGQQIINVTGTPKGAYYYCLI